MATSVRTLPPSCRKAVSASTRPRRRRACPPGGWFTGTVHVDTIAPPSGRSRLSASSVHFTPARGPLGTHAPRPDGLLPRDENDGGLHECGPWDFGGVGSLLHRQSPGLRGAAGSSPSGSGRLPAREVAAVRFALPGLRSAAQGERSVHLETSPSADRGSPNGRVAVTRGGAGSGRRSAAK